jgi:O-antigen/teichoic acid export membrane protein
LGTLLVFGGPLLMALFGRTYEANWAVLAPVIARGCVGALVVPLGVALLAHGRQILFLVQQVGFGATVLTFTYLWRTHGGTGLALAEVTGAIFLIALRMPGLAKMGMLTRRTSLTLIGATVAAPVVAGLGWWCPDEWRLAGAVFFTAAAAVGCLRFLPTLHERRRLWGLLSGLLRRSGRALD